MRRLRLRCAPPSAAAAPAPPTAAGGRLRSGNPAPA